jgi:hypothetical protein
VKLHYLTYKIPQKVGSPITYYRRCTLQSLCGSTSRDDDGNIEARVKVERDLKLDVPLRN